MKVDVLDLKGQKVREMELPANVFEAPVNVDLMHQAYTRQMANARLGTHQTKVRSEVRGGGRKPFKQKGTGRARFGSSRVPIWRGGGITFGPTGEENYTKQMNTKAKRLAIRQALSLASTSDKITVIEAIVTKDGKTAELAKLLGKINATRKVLIVVDEKSPELMRAAQNLQEVKVVSSRYVNVYDVLNADSIVFSQDALKATTNWLSQEVKPTTKAAKGSA